MSIDFQSKKMQSNELGITYFFTAVSDNLSPVDRWGLFLIIKICISYLP